MDIVKKHLTVREHFNPYPSRGEWVGIRLLNFQHPVDTYPQHFLEQADFNYMPLVERVMYVRSCPKIVPRNVRSMLPKRYEVSKTIFVVKPVVPYVL